MYSISDVPKPDNEPVLSYAPGTPERAAVKQALDDLAGNPVEVPAIIGGREVYSGDKAPIVAPHDRELQLGVYHKASPDMVQEAVNAALAARREWTALPWEERAAVLLRAAELLSGPYRARANAATMLGQSKTVHQAEIDAACELADFWRFSAYNLPRIYAQQPEHSPPGIWNRLSYRPLEGFVLAVSPFNFTSLSTNLATGPAVMGNVVIWKPASTAVLGVHVIMQILMEAGLPPGVVNMLPGPGAAIGEPLVADPHLAGIHFTGSTGTFQNMWRLVGQNITNYHTYPRIVGETGGKDFLFVHASADLDALTPSVIRGAFEYQGQKCSALSRLYVPRSLWPQVRDRVVGAMDELRMGDVRDFRNFVSAVIDEKAWRKIGTYLEHAAHADDLKIVTGGEMDDRRGWFIRPALVESENPRSKLMAEEIFGPVLTAYVYDDKRLDETLELCDATSPYGLTGGVFANDRAAIHKISAALQNAAGNFYVNDKITGSVVGQQPFGGSRASGTNDKAGSYLNLLRWVTTRTVKENFNPPRDYRYPFMQEP